MNAEETMDQPTSEPTTLRALFHQLVRDCYSTGVGIRDEELTGYIADILTDFTTSDKVYAIRDRAGRPLHSLAEMITASDPVYGHAWSFTREREVRKHIGDFALFFTGLFPEAVHPTRSRRAAPAAIPDSLLHMMQYGKESYYVVSQFNVFEFAPEAPLFEKLAEKFEGCVYGLHLVRSELEKRKSTAANFPSIKPKRLM
jgi:hypothetical protein